MFLLQPRAASDVTYRLQEAIAGRNPRSPRHPTSRTCQDMSKDAAFKGQAFYVLVACGNYCASRGFKINITAIFLQGLHRPTVLWKAEEADVYPFCPI